MKPAGSIFSCFSESLCEKDAFLSSAFSVICGLTLILEAVVSQPQGKSDDRRFSPPFQDFVYFDFSVLIILKR